MDIEVEKFLSFVSTWNFPFGTLDNSFCRLICYGNHQSILPKNDPYCILVTKKFELQYLITTTYLFIQNIAFFTEL